MIQLLGVIAVLGGFFWAYKRLRHSATDSVTQANRKRLGLWLLVLSLLFWVFALSLSSSLRR